MTIQEKIIFQNTHWKEGKFTTFTFKRHLFGKVWADIDTRLIALITGPRRTGKSVLLKQIVNELISAKKITPTQILFFEFSPTQATETIWEVYNFFAKEVCDPRQAVYIFFDEIQFIRNYEVTIKEIYDNATNSPKIFLTGSLSLSYKRRMEESLSGRFFSYKFYPLNFAEYLELSKPESFTLFQNVRVETDRFKREHLLGQLNADFRKFLKHGRLPEMVSFTPDQSRNYLYTIISQSLNQDAFSYFTIEKPQIINALFEYIRLNSGGLISIYALAGELSVSSQTVASYLSVLETMGLTYLIYNSIHPLIRLNSAKKAYVSSMHFLCETKLDLTAATGFAVESYILERLLEKGESVTFFRHREKEVDFLLPKKKNAYEVKYTSQPRKTGFVPKGYQLEIISLDKNMPACLF